MRCLLLFIGFLSFLSCKETAHYVTYHDFSNEIWPAKDTIVFDLPNSFTGKHPSLIIRHSPDYKFQNLWIKLAVDEQEFLKKECQLSNGKGYWLGKKNGKLYSQTILLEEISLPSDSSKIKLIHFMRTQELDAIQSIGLLVE